MKPNEIMKTCSMGNSKKNKKEVEKSVIRILLKLKQNAFCILKRAIATTGVATLAKPCSNP